MYYVAYIIKIREKERDLQGCNNAMRPNQFTKLNISSKGDNLFFVGLKKNYLLDVKFEEIKRSFAWLSKE